MSGSGSDGPQETSLDKELASIGVSREQDYQKTFVPLEKYAINKTVQQQPALQQQALGISNANYQQQFGNAQNSLVNGIGNRNTGGGGALVSNLGKFATNRGTAIGQGQVASQLQSQSAYQGNLQNLVNIGQGKAAGAQQGLNNSALASNQQSIIDARAATAATNAVSGAVGTGAGLAFGQYAAPKIYTGS